MPLVVLVNRGSASASEIVAAALKQNNRALILGQTTFGKGSVQQLRQFRDGSAIKMTISKYLTPNNTSIQSIGVTPHVELNPLIISKDLIQIVKSSELDPKNSNSIFSKWGDVVDNAEKKLVFAFDDKFSHSIFSIKDDRKANAGFDVVQLRKDYPLYLAAKFLTDSQVKQKIKKVNFNDLKNNAYKVIDEETKEQAKKLSQKLGKLGIQWTNNGSPPTTKSKINFWAEKSQKDKKPCLTKSSNNKIIAGDKIYLCAEVTNLSKKRSAKLRAISKSNTALFHNRQFVFGNLKPQEKKTWYIPITIYDTFTESTVFVKFNLFTAEGKKNLAKEFSFHIKGSPQSFFSYQIQTYSEKGKKRAITPSDRVKLEVNLKNISQTDSGVINVSLKNGEGNKVLLTKAKANIPVLKKGQSHKIKFEFILKKALKDKKIDLSLSITDNTYLASGIEHNFSIPYEQKNIPLIQNSPPIISIQSYPFVSKKKSVVVNFNVKDDAEVESVFILQNEKKKFYRRFEKLQVKDKVSLQLEEGLNRIYILSRDNFDVVSRKQIYIQKR